LGRVVQELVHLVGAKAKNSVRGRVQKEILCLQRSEAWVLRANKRSRARDMGCCLDYRKEDK
jgi:hypothetical protein